MSIGDIEGTVVDIIADKLGLEPSEVTSDASFTDDLGADSLDTVELIMAFESEFDIKIPDEDADQLVTVGGALSYVLNKIETG